jgi:hypothetical protein
MQVLVYEMQMNDFGRSILENDPSFKIEILETLGDEDDLLPMYRVRVTETREHEDGDGVLVHLHLES